MPGPPARPALAALFLVLGLAARPANADAPPPPLPAYLGPPPASALPPPDPITLEIAPRAGFSRRLGSAPGVPITNRLGGVLGLGAAIAPWHRFAIGVGWEHSLIGSERSDGDLADVSVSRSMDVIWASLRLYLVRGERVGLLVQLGPGLAIQHATADVIVYPAAGMRPTVSRCSETGGPGLALRAGLGFEARLAGALWITADALFDNVHLSTDALGDCVAGAGTLSLLGMRFGLTYRGDVSRWLR